MITSTLKQFNNYKTLLPTLDTHYENLHEVYKERPDNFLLHQFFEPENRKRTRITNQHPTTSQPKETQTEH